MWCVFVITDSKLTQTINFKNLWVTDCEYSSEYRIAIKCVQHLTKIIIAHLYVILFLTSGIVLRLIVDHGGPGNRGGGNEAQQQKLHVGLTSQTEHDSHSRPVLKYLILFWLHVDVVLSTHTQSNESQFS